MLCHTAMEELQYIDGDTEYLEESLQMGWRHHVLRRLNGMAMLVVAMMNFRQVGL
jgi:hypothetical protein